MSNPAVYEVGHVQGMDGATIHVGVAYDAVTIRATGNVPLSRQQAETFAQLLVRASWAAGQHT